MTGPGTKPTRLPPASPMEGTVSDDDHGDGTSEANAVTRCVCMKKKSFSSDSDDDEGLMVQCDECEVWQHCNCMGLTEESIPDQYYCEQCRPQNHRASRQSTKRYYNPMGFESDEKSYSPNDSSRRRKRQQRGKNETPEDTSSNAEPLHNAGLPSTNQIVAPESLPLLKPADKLFNDDINDTTKPTPLPTKRAPPSSHAIEDRKRHAPKRQNSGGQRSTATGARKSKRSQPVREASREASRSSTPVLEDTQTTTTAIVTTITAMPAASWPTAFWNKQGEPRPSSQDSQPAKIKYPHAKMTFADMHRRAKQLKDHIQHLRKSYTPPATIPSISPSCKKNIPYLPPLSAPADLCPSQPQSDRPRSLSTSSTASSTSTASTEPLMTEDGSSSSSSSSLATQTSSPQPLAVDKLLPVPDSKSLDIMDCLLQKLSHFEQQYGVAG
ncbi:hypothetical protein DM01DRAFT_1336597 [Hesseltinella vesiculosa]|uniref:PHD-type domain-containing protein n=1 Tax=Hesseltinella vesiculosa TaxID=101127 RepID=A0A1X2GFV1_9FUNG|nr:hypothetical protein DM01DRAFT_1336597 [Hesseltinella vesiculosa]